MLSFLKFVVFLIITFIIITVIRIIVGLVRFSRLLRKLPKQGDNASGGWKNKVRSPEAKNGRRNDGTIELGKDDYKIE
jgi:hypothetical protein